MEQQQRQLAILEEALKANKRIEAINDENEKLKETLASRQAVLNRLQNLSLAAASLLGSVDSTAKETEPSSLECLAKLDRSDAVVPKDNEEDEDSVKLIIGKYLNQLLAVVVQNIQECQGKMDIISLLKLESTINQLFAFAEEKQIIPETDENNGWKKAMLMHQKLFAQIQQLIGGGVEEEEANEE